MGILKSALESEGENLKTQGEALPLKYVIHTTKAIKSSPNSKSESSVIHQNQ